MITLCFIYRGCTKNVMEEKTQPQPKLCERQVNTVQKHKHGINMKPGAGQIRRRDLQVSAVELHDPLLHLLLVRQQLVRPQEVSVSYIIVVANLRCG